MTGSDPAPVPPAPAPVAAWREAPFRPIEPETGQEEAVAGLLAACAPAGETEGGRALLARFRSEEGTEVYGLTIDSDVVAVYALRRVPMARELAAVTVALGYRRQGLGRAALADALRRCGARPLVAEADEATLAFYRACGFKPVGRRTGPDGSPRYRLGLHAPRPRPGR